MYYCDFRCMVSCGDIHAHFHVQEVSLIARILSRLIAEPAVLAEASPLSDMNSNDDIPDA